MKQYLILFLFVLPLMSGLNSQAVYADTYEGLSVSAVEVSCISAEELAKLIRKQITIQAGDRFSQEAVRESIRKMYAMKRFVQITVEAERDADGVRLSFCPQQIDTISKIQIIGNKAVNAERIKNVLDIKIGDQVPPNGMKALTQRLLQLYRNQGYHQVKIDLEVREDPGFDKKIMTVTIQEGVPSKIGSVTFAGQRVLNEKALLNASKLHRGMHFTLEAVEEAGELIEQLYAQQGYFHAEISDRDMQYNFETGEVNLTLTVNEGKTTGIRFEGNAQIKTKALKSLIDVNDLRRGIAEDILKENAATLSAYYRARGYHFVVATVEQSQENDAPVITFRIEEGPQVEVEQITIEGNQAYKAKHLQTFMLTAVGGWFSKGIYQENVFKDDLLAIKGFYQQQGYLNAEVLSASIDFSRDQRHVKLHLVIHEGVQTRINTLRIVGETEENVLKNLRKRLKVHEDEPLNLTQLKETVDQFQEFYANRGYIKAEIREFKEFSAAQSRVDLTLKIERGIQFFIGRITVQGVIRTKKAFIMRELQIAEGDIYNPQKIRDTVKRLLQLGFYDSVTLQVLDTKSMNPVQDMLLVVRETSAKDVEFGIGYSTETNVKGFIEYSDKNVLNYGGKAIARLDASIERPKMTLQYRHPHFLTRDNSLLLSVYDDIQRDNDSFEVEKQGGRIALQQDIASAFSASLGYFFEIDDPSKVREDAMLFERDSEKLNFAGFDAHASWDTRNDVIMPTKGGYARLTLRSSLDFAGAETEFLEFTGQSIWYQKLFDGVILASSLQGKRIEPLDDAEQTPIYTRYFLGGDGSVRGFERHEIGPTGTEGNKIGGNRMFALNTELRFPIYSVLGGVVFFDAGANWLNNDGFESNDLRKTLGLGLRVATPVGPLRVDYGYKLDRRSGESVGEYYVAIGSTF